MIRGISFEVPQGTSDILWQILGCIDITQYYWYNIKSQDETWTDIQGSDFFNNNYYDGNSFFKQIHLNHYIVFLKIQAYLQEGEFSDIHTYNEFLCSSCQLLILVYDCEFVEIYLKSKEIANIMYQNAKAKQFKNIQYITDYNCGRIKMDVL